MKGNELICMQAVECMGMQKNVHKRKKMYESVGESSKMFEHLEECT